MNTKEDTIAPLSSLDDMIICDCCGYEGTVDEFLNEHGVLICPQCGNLYED